MDVNKYEDRVPLFFSSLRGGQVFTSDHDYTSYPCISLVGKSLFRPAWEIRLTGSALESVPALGPAYHKLPKGSHVHNEFKKKIVLLVQLLVS